MFRLPNCEFAIRSFLSLLFFTSISCGSVYALEPVDFKVGGFGFSRPGGWDWIVPSSPMRKAQLDFTAPDGGKAEVNFFHFGPGQGGGVEANVQRWFSQFQNAQTARSESSVNGVRIVNVEAEGTFLSGMPGTTPVPLENHALRGAILEDSTGGDVFVKMTGPTGTVQAAWPAFDQMVRAAAESKTGAPAP